MLITFRVANFLSFNEEEEFSMLAGKQRKPVRPAVPLATGVEALKLAVVYGANASGKSNLVRSIDFARSVITWGLKQMNSNEDHFRLLAENREKSTKFEFEFELKGKIYAYGMTIQLDKKMVQEEWLFELKKTTQKAIFEREVDKNGKSFFLTKPDLKGEDGTRFSIYAQDVQKNELLLSLLGSKPWDNDSFFSILGNIYEWFNAKLKVFYTDTQIATPSFLATNDLSTEADNLAFIKLMLKQFDTGIIDVEQIDEVAGETFDQLTDSQKTYVLSRLNRGILPGFTSGRRHYIFSQQATGKIKSSYLRTRHKANGTDSSSNFDFEDESDGTKRLFTLIPILRLLTLVDVTVVIDEIDRSLHPGLLHKFISFFLDSAQNIKSQLIVTTHESSLLDLSLLRRDEAWFVEKNNHGESHIYSLEEFQPRFDKEIRKAYLLGRYGAIPFISDVQQLNWEIANAEG